MKIKNIYPFKDIVRIYEDYDQVRQPNEKNGKKTLTDISKQDIQMTRDIGEGTQAHL